MMSLIASIQNSLHASQHKYTKMEKIFHDLCRELCELVYYRNFLFHRHRYGVTLEYQLNSKVYSILHLCLDMQGVLYFESWEYKEGKHTKVTHTFEAPVSYLASTTSGMICRRLSDLGVYSLEKK